MRSARRGFTLIELMVVITVIAIISSIAIPSFLRARMTANEISSIAIARTVMESQSIFKRTDYDSDGKFEYAYPFYQLFEVNAANRPELVTKDVAGAHILDATYGIFSKNGYLMFDNVKYNSNGTWSDVFRGNEPNRVVDRFGVHIFPESYNMSGVNIFAADDHGQIWQKDASLDSSYTTNGYTWFMWDSGTEMKNQNWVAVQ